MSKPTDRADAESLTPWHTLEVPRIAAPTVAENRDLRETSILNAANTIAREQGLDKVTFSAVAKLSGMSRTAVYAYFDSSADLIADVLIDELFDMNELLTVRVGQATDCRQAISAWMRASLEYVNDGRHELVKSAATVELPPTRRAEMAALHRGMITPLVSALDDCGVSDAAHVALFISGVVDASVRRLTNGGNLEDEIAAAEQFILHGLTAFTH